MVPFPRHYPHGKNNRELWREMKSRLMSRRALIGDMVVKSSTDINIHTHHRLLPVSNL